MKAVVSDSWGAAWSPFFRVISRRSEGQGYHCSWQGLIRLRDDSLLCTFGSGPLGDIDAFYSAYSTVIDLCSTIFNDALNHLNLDGTPYMWGLLGKWEAVLDSDPNHGWLLKGTYDAGAPAKAFRGERTWTDYSVQAQFKLGDQGLPATQCAAGVYLRIRDEDPMTTDGLFQDFYQCFVFYSAYPPSAWKIRLSKYINGFWVADLGTQALSQFNPAAWSSLLVEVRDHTNPARVSLRCYVNSELAEFEDAQPPLIPAGRVGLSVNSGVARFDNIAVEELE